MAEPARSLSIPLELEPDEEESGLPLLQRWVERSDGTFDLVEMPLTPELFLNQKLGDKIVQKNIHDVVCFDLRGILFRRFRPEPDVKIFHDLQHRLGVPGLSKKKPCPDISIVRGARRRRDRGHFDVAKEGVRPFLIIEILSPDSKRIRDVDTVDKKRQYALAGIPEYFHIDPPRPKKPGFVTVGYRLISKGRYRRIKPDAEGWLLSETTGLLFPVRSDEEERLPVLDAQTRERLLYPDELLEAIEAEAAREAAARGMAEEKAAREARARRVAEERAAREAVARRAEEAARRVAEAENARLREEIERLKRGE